jgi:hypothetical protein
MAIKTSTQVADELGITRESLIVYLGRHPELKPAKRIEPSGDFIWTDEEIEQLAEARRNKSKGGRPKKQ